MFPGRAYFASQILKIINNSLVLKNFNFVVIWSLGAVGPSLCVHEVQLHIPKCSIVKAHRKKSWRRPWPLAAAQVFFIRPCQKRV